MDKLENDQLYQILFSIKEQPWVFLGQKSLWALDNYIAGYLNACSVFDPECFTIRWQEEFYHYVCDVYHIYKENYTISGIIRYCGYSDSDGLQLYFKLLENFSKERYNMKHATPTHPLQHGEVRAFRLDCSKMVDFAGKYIKEHSEDFFGIPGPEEGCAYVFSLSRENILTCMVYNNSSWKKITDNLSHIDQLPVFSGDDLVKYTVLLQE